MLQTSHISKYETFGRPVHYHVISWSSRKRLKKGASVPIRWLSQMRSQSKLIRHGAGKDEQPRFLACKLRNVRFECSGAHVRTHYVVPQRSDPCRVCVHFLRWGGHRVRYRKQILLRYRRCRNWFVELKVDEQVKEREIATRWESASALLKLKLSLAAWRNVLRLLSRLEAILAGILEGGRNRQNAMLCSSS